MKNFLDSKRKLGNRMLFFPVFVLTLFIFQGTKLYVGPDPY